MKLSELKKRDDFDELAERAHHVVDTWEEFDIVRSQFKDLLSSDDNPLTVARQIDKWYQKNVMG